MKKLPAALALTAVFALAQAVPATAATYPSCRLGGSLPVVPTSLHVGNPGVQATDPSGRYQVTALLPDDGSAQTGAWIWRNGAGAQLVALTPGYLEVADVNVRGDAVGSAATDSAPQHGWRIRNGRRTDLPQPAGQDSTRAVAVNSTGEIAGNAGSPAPGGRAVEWTADDVPRVLPVPSGFDTTQATDIDDDGTVVGSATQYDSTGMIVKVEPVVWPATGGYRLLPTSDNAGGEVQAVRNGIAVGADGEHPARWDLADDTRTALSTAEGSAYAINAGGDLLLRLTSSQPDVPTIQFVRSGLAPRRIDPRDLPGQLSDSGKVFVGTTIYDCSGPAQDN